VTVLAAGPEIIGAQRPRLASVPYSCSYAFGEQTVEFARKSGLILDDWQAWGLTRSMGTREDGRWAAFEVCWICARQNGKNAVLEARQLGGLYVIGEELQIHTAHEFKACSEHFRRIETIIRGSPELLRKVKRNGIRTSHGEEAIELLATPTLIFGARGTQVRRSVAPRLRFLARSRGSGRAFTAEAVYYDEAMLLAQEDVDASMPTMSAVPNPQMWFTGSAGFPDSTQLSSVRDRGIAGTDPTLLFVEWSCEFCPDLCPDKRSPRCRFGHDRRDDPKSWARANPGLNIRISEEHVGREFIKMAATGFDRERLGIGDWPAGDLAFAVIPKHNWDERIWPGPGEMPRPQRIAVWVDITPDQSAAAIAIAGLLPQKAAVTAQELLDISLDPASPPPLSQPLPERECTLEIGNDGTWDDHRAGVDWILPRLRELKSRQRVAVIGVDPIGPGAELITAIENEPGLAAVLQTCQLRDVTQANAQFLRGLGVPPAAELPGPDGPPKATIWHRDQPDMRRAVAAAVQRDVGDGQHAWARKDTSEDISPLCAGTMAVWAARKFGRGYDVLKSVL
jgi:hypothetical protein